MKPDFALSLSFTGISLLYRAGDGWRSVGKVALYVNDLAAAVAELRTRAVTLSGEPVRCKIVIPNDQIRYLTIQSGSFQGETRHEMARAALEGATPYDVADLVFDLSLDGEQTHIAAVACDTLAEAETFARTYGFEPVSFVAIPDGAPFSGEPFFGSTDDLKDTIERDAAAIEVIGPVADLATEAETESSTPDLPDPDDTLVAESTEQTQDDPASDAQSPSPIEPASDPADLGGASSDPDTEPADQDAGRTQRPSAGFATRRRKSGEDGKPPPLAGARRDGPAPTPTNSSPDEADSTAGPDSNDTQGKATVAAAVASPSIDIPDEESKPESPHDRSFTARFLSRRKHRKDAAARETGKSRAPNAPVPAPTAQTFETGSESERMTIFGARAKPAVGGKPRHLGLVLTIGLLLFLAAVAAWSALFMNDRLSGLFGGASEETAEITAPSTQAPDVQSTAPELTESARDNGDAVETPAPDAEDEQIALLPQDDTGLADAPVATEPAPDQAPGETVPEALATLNDAARYAATGIWQRAPKAPEPPATAELSELYDVSIDRRDLSKDAVALPPLASLDTDQAPGSVASPAVAGTDFDLDERGLVKPTANGALNPDGVLVFLGRPPVVPPATPTRFETDPEADIAAQQDRLAAFRPQLRPEDFAEQTERSQLGGLTRSELGGLRPKLRPETVKREAEEDETPTAQAVVVSKTPKPRPGDFAAKVKQAQQRNAGPSAQVATATATVAPRTVSPSIPSSASVSRQATVNNAINLRKVNLIGVYGTPSNRRALVRLSNGRYKKVQVGDSVDGGRIVAIGDSELRYQKGGRNVTLKMPSG